MKSVMEASPMFFPGREVTIQTPERTLTLTIDKPFTPFTKAVRVVLLARSPELGPNPVVVKIYDPRLLDERLVGSPRRPPRLWSLEAEQAVDAIWDEPFDEFEVRSRSPEDAAGRAEFAMLWEKHFRLLSTGCFETERGSSQAPSSPQTNAPSSPLRPSSSDVPADAITPKLCAALLRTVDSFAAYGVVHTDVNGNNILFMPSERPTRVVVIDFGCGGVREEDRDDEAWEDIIEFSHDSWQMRWVLKQRGIVIPTE